MKKEYIVLGVVVFLLFVIIVALVSIESAKPDFEISKVDVWGNVVDVTIQNVGSKKATGVTVYLYNDVETYMGYGSLESLGVNVVKTVKIWYSGKLYAGSWIKIICDQGVTETFAI